jgi:hypothetical protein
MIAFKWPIVFQWPSSYAVWNTWCARFRLINMISFIAYASIVDYPEKSFFRILHLLPLLPVWVQQITASSYSASRNRTHFLLVQALNITFGVFATIHDGIRERSVVSVLVPLLVICLPSMAALCIGLAGYRLERNSDLHTKGSCESTLDHKNGAEIEMELDILPSESGPLTDAYNTQGLRLRDFISIHVLDLQHDTTAPEKVASHSFAAMNRNLTFWATSKRTIMSMPLRIRLWTRNLRLGHHWHMHYKLSNYPSSLNSNTPLVDTSSTPALDLNMARSTTSTSRTLEWEYALRLLLVGTAFNTFFSILNFLCFAPSRTGRQFALNARERPCMFISFSLSVLILVHAAFAMLAFKALRLQSWLLARATVFVPGTTLTVVIIVELFVDKPVPGSEFFIVVEALRSLIVVVYVFLLIVSALVLCFGGKRLAKLTNFEL